MAYLKLPIISGGGGGGSTSDDISNLSTVAGSNITQALNVVDSEITNVENLQVDSQYKPNAPYNLTNTDIANKYIILAEAPYDKNKTQVFVVNGLPQEYGVDFVVTTDDGGKRLSWSGLGMESVLTNGDKIIVLYN